jgi:hypothetical protein
MAGPGKIDAFVQSATYAHALAFAFDIGQAGLKDAHRSWLDANVLPMVNAGGSIMVIGMASRSGPDAGNLALSKRRADAVVAHLRGKTRTAFNVASQTAVGEQAAKLAGLRDGVEGERWRAVMIVAWPKPTPPPPPPPPPPPVVTPAEATKTIPRPLTDGEKALLKPIFGDTLDYDRQVVARNDSNTGGEWNSFTPGYLPNMSTHLWSWDYSTAVTEHAAVFVHEMVHVWQSGHGSHNILRGAYLWIKYDEYEHAYKYNLDSSSSFSYFNMEQQGAIIEDYYLVSKGLTAENNTGMRANLGAYLPYIAQLKAAGAFRWPHPGRKNRDNIGNKI